MRNILSLLLVVFLFPVLVNGQETKEEKKAAKEAKKNAPPQKGSVYFSPVPVIGANPASGFIFGAGASTSWYMGDPATTRLSSALAGGAYTTKSQLIFTLKSTVFTENNDWILMGDWRYLDSSQPTWGIGTGPQSAKLSSNSFTTDEGKIVDGVDESDLMKFEFIRFYETFLKKLNDNGLYAGVGVHLDFFSNIDDQLLNLDTVPQQVTPYYSYTEKHGFDQDKSTLIGLSANVVYDTRDNINAPYAGRYAFASFKVNPDFLGSDQNSTSLWLEYRDYFDLTGDHHNILALWAFGNFTTSGNLPYMSLPAIGWDQYARSGAPYAQGRFRGINMMYGGLEYRKHVYGSTKNPDFIGIVAFANATTADGDSNGIDLFQYFDPGYGLGLRINISKKARTNLGIDYGWGNYNSTGLFIRLNENF